MKKNESCNNFQWTTGLLEVLYSTKIGWQFVIFLNPLQKQPLTPNPNLIPCCWWAHWVVAPYYFFGLCPIGQNPATRCSHQKLASELPPHL